MFSDLFQATQLDSERQQNSNAGVTPNCPRAAPEEEQGAAGHPHKTRPPPTPPRPAHACALPPPPPGWWVGIPGALGWSGTCIQEIISSWDLLGK